MKRFFSALLLLPVLCWGLPALASANSLVFKGKSFSLKKEEVDWPFSMKPVDPRKKPVSLYKSVQPEVSEEDKSAVELGSDLAYFQVIKVNGEIGQHIDGGQPIIWYKIPLANAIQERENLSHRKIDDLERLLATVNYNLARAEVDQTELEKGVSIHTEAQSKQRNNALNYDTLLKQKDSLLTALDLATTKYNNDIELAKGKYGKDFTVEKFSTTSTVSPMYGGTLLWINPSLKPGMIYTKKTKLFSIGQLDPILIRAIVYEMDLHKIKIGDKVTITFQDFPGKTYESAIDSINYVPQTTDPQVPVYYEIDLYIPNPDLRIKEGMRCDVAVNIP